MHHSSNENKSCIIQYIQYLKKNSPSFKFGGLISATYLLRGEAVLYLSAQESEYRRWGIASDLDLDLDLSLSVSMSLILILILKREKRENEKGGSVYFCRAVCSKVKIIDRLD